jgi:hypothetical protein
MTLSLQTSLSMGKVRRWLLSVRLGAALWLVGVPVLHPGADYARTMSSHAQGPSQLFKRNLTLQSRQGLIFIVIFPCYQYTML